MERKRYENKEKRITDRGIGTGPGPDGLRRFGSPGRFWIYSLIRNKNCRDRKSRENVDKDRRKSEADPGSIRPADRQDGPVRNLI